MNLVRARSWGRVKPPPGSKIEAGHPLASGMVLCWLFNEGGGLVATDIAGQWNGRLQGTASFGQAYGLTGLRASSGTTYAQLAASGGSWFVNDWTVSFRVASDSIAATRALWHIDGTSGLNNRLDCYYISSARLKVDVYSSAGAASSIDASTASWAAGVPVHFTIRSKGGTVAAFIDGKSVGTVAAPTRAANTQPLGFLYDGGDTPVPIGDQFVVWQRGLTTEEINLHVAEPYAFVAAPGPKILYIDLAGPPTGNSVSLAGSGANSSAGRAAMQATLVVAGKGANSTAGRAANGKNETLGTAKGANSSAGRADMQLAVAVAGKGPACTAGKADLTVSQTTIVTLDGKGSNSTAGRADLQRAADLTGRGSASTAGKASLDVVASLSSHGDASSAGKAALQVLAALAAQGSSSSAGKADLRVVCAFAGFGAACSAGNATALVLAALTGRGANSTAGTAAMDVLLTIALDGKGANSTAGSATLAAIQFIDDPDGLTLTIRERHHTVTIRDEGHTATVRHRGHMVTAREQH